MAKPLSRTAAARRAGGLHLDVQLCFALYSTSLAMTRIYRPMLVDLGLTYPQYIVMLALWQHATLTMGQLGEQVSLDSGTLAPLIRRLKALDLVDRVRSASDDRSVVISRTRAGIALRERAHAVHESVAYATQCDSTERLAMTTGLRKLRAALLGTHE